MFCDEMGGRRGGAVRHRSLGRFWCSGTWDIGAAGHCLGAGVRCYGHIYFGGMLLCVIFVDVLWFSPRE